MKIVQKKILILFVIAFSLSILIAKKPLSYQSKVLEKLRMQLFNKSSNKNELLYLNKFPKSFHNFINVFYDRDCGELYHQHMEHLALLKSLSVKHTEKVLDIWLSVSINAHWKSDAVGIIQNQLAEFAVKDLDRFIKNLKKRKKCDQYSIIAFLADKESHDYYQDYQKIIDGLVKIGEKKIMKIFIDEREKRKKKRYN